MSGIGFQVLEAAGRRIDDIYVYSRDTWGDAQARRYVGDLFACFEAIAARRVVWRRIPAESRSTAITSDMRITTSIGVCSQTAMSAS